MTAGVAYEVNTAASNTVTQAVRPELSMHSVALLLGPETQPCTRHKQDVAALTA
jgi:hypothetical protein